MYIPALCNIHGICMVYTIHIPCKIFIGVPDVHDVPSYIVVPDYDIVVATISGIPMS